MDEYEGIVYQTALISCLTFPLMRGFLRYKFNVIPYFHSEKVADDMYNGLLILIIAAPLFEKISTDPIITTITVIYGVHSLMHGMMDFRRHPFASIRKTDKNEQESNKKEV